jgi:hypothetical protein
LVDGAGEEEFAVEDAGILGEEAEDQPGEKVVEILPAVRGIPIRVLLQQFDVETVEAAGGLDVERVFADLLDGGDACQRQKEAKFIAKLGVAAGNGLAIDEIFGLKVLAVGGEDELGLVAVSGRTLPQLAESRCHSAFADLEMDVVALEYPARRVGLVCVSAFQPFEGGFLIPEGFEEGIWESFWVEGRFREPRNGFFYFDCVHSNTAFQPRHERRLPPHWQIRPRPILARTASCKTSARPFPRWRTWKQKHPSMLSLSAALANYGLPLPALHAQSSRLVCAFGDAMTQSLLNDFTRESALKKRKDERAVFILGIPV